MKQHSPSLPLLPPGSKRAYWACQIGGWGLYGSSQLFTASFVLHLPLLRASAEIFTLYTAALVLTHLLRGYMRRHRWDALSKSALIPRAMLASMILGAPLGLALSFMSVAVLQGGNSGQTQVIVDGATVTAVTMTPTVRTIANIANQFSTIGLWTILYFTILGARKRRWVALQHSELTRALQLAELRLLKNQLNPHFLFNSLNSVRALIADDPARAQDAVTQLARTLRYTLASGEEELVTLEQELEIVNDYLALESLRLAERLKIKLDIADAALHVRIPVMLLQTVVENAIKHGIAELPAGGVLRLSAQVHDGALMLSVENPRPAGPTQRQHEGIGLRNSAQRLQLLFGAEARLDLDLSDPQRAVTRIRIPVSA